MAKVVTIEKSIIAKRKWTPKFSYIYKKLENSPNAIELENFIDYGPINGIDLRNFGEKGKNYIRISDMRRFFISYSDIKQVSIDKIPQKIKLQENDILISRKGTPGITVITTTQDLDNVIGTEAILLRVKNNYDPYYLTAFFNSKVFFEQVINNLSGAVASGINHPSLKKLKVLYDKKLVVNISQKVKKTIQLQVKSAKILQKAKKLFYKELNIDFPKIKKEKHYSVKLSDFAKDNLWTPAFSYPLYINTLKAIKKKWKTIPLGEIATVKKGDEVGSINYNKYLDKKDTDVPFIRTSDLVNYEVDQFPDFYIPEEIYQELKQDIKAGDVLYNNDGKIGFVATLTTQDKVIIQSHIRRLRLKPEAKKYNITSEYLFLVLTIKEVARYQAERFTVIQSTIPTISNHLFDFEIPILDKNSLDEITKLVKEAFELKNQKKKLIKEIREEIDSYFDI